MSPPRAAVGVVAAASLAAAAYAVRRLLRRRRVVQGVRAMGKVEFHAHLNGSIRLSTLVELAEARGLAGARALLAGPRTLEACFEIFALIHQCVDSLAVVRRVAREALEDFEAAGCCYVELRSTPRALGEHTEADYVEAVVDVMATYGGALTPRFLASVDRSRGPAAAAATVAAVAALRRGDARARAFVVGVDFSGNPTSRHSFEAFERLFRECRDAHGLGLAIHVGECPRGDADASRILALARETPGRCRLGHALHVAPEDLCGAGAPLVEVCPSSNVATLRLASLRGHPRLGDVFARGFDVPLCLCTDDTAVFGTDLAAEYLKVRDAFGLELRDLALLVARAADRAFDAPACRAALARHGTPR